MLYSKNCGFHTFRAFVHANFKSLEFDWATMIASAPGSMRTLMLPTTQPMQPWKDLLSWWSLLHHWDGICNCKTWWKLVAGGCFNLICACVELLIYFRMAPNWLVMLLVFYLCRAELHTSPEHPLMGCSPRQTQLRCLCSCAPLRKPPGTCVVYPSTYLANFGPSMSALMSYGKSCFAYQFISSSIAILCSSHLASGCQPKK